MLQIKNLIPSLVFNMSIAATTNEKLFLNCCTILWVLAHYEQFRKVC
jgi:hypothetical protein